MRTLKCVVLCVALAGWNATSDAARYGYSIAMGETLGFGHSALTEADTEFTFHPGFWAGGSLGNLTGPLQGELTSSAFTISPSTLTLTGIGVGPVGNDVWTMEFTGGTLTVPPSAFTNTGTLLGTMDYIIRDETNAVYDSGSFYVVDINFAGYANNVSGAGIYIWANNWNNLTTTRDEFINNGGIPMGIDLGGIGGTIPVPEPSQWVLAMTGLATLLTYRRVRRGR